MSKVSNIIRFYEFDTEGDLYAQIDTDLETSYSGDNRIYRLQTVQIIEPNKALVVMEEDTDRMVVQFYYRYLDFNQTWNEEEMEVDGLSSDYMIMSVQELQMLGEIKKITLNSLDYEIYNMEYIIESKGVKTMIITLQ